jgi:pyruvate dehydrogenase E2 component (dihydrolipoamide acetyltransferase)
LFFIPKLGQTVEEVTLVQWLVQDGEKVSQGQAVMDVETDKAVFPVEANAKGIIHFGPYKEGDVLPVLTVVAIIGKPEDQFVVSGDLAPLPQIPALKEEVVDQGEMPSEKKVEDSQGGEIFASPRARMLAAEKQVDLTEVTPTGYGGIRIAERDVFAYLDQLPRITPVARRMASEANVDLHGVAGTGPGGRIVKEDVARATQVVPQDVPMLPLPIADVIERIPLTGVRNIIADRMGISAHTTARVTLFMEVDATEFVAARERPVKCGRRVAAPGYNDLLAKIVPVILRKFLNARPSMPSNCLSRQYRHRSGYRAVCWCR